MKRPTRAAIWLRLITITTALTMVVVGVTYALFQSNMTEIQGSTISSASAHLLLSGNNVAYSDTLPGFAFSQLQPGGPAAPTDGFDVYFKNDGTAPLSLAVNVGDGLINLQHVNTNKLWLQISSTTGGQDHRFSMASLINAYKTGTYSSPNEQLAAGATAHYKLRIQMDADALTTTTSAATIQSVDMLFIGNADNS